MAGARSPLLEGLDTITEEEQLRLALELSNADTAGGGGLQFESPPQVMSTRPPPPSDPRPLSEGMLGSMETRNEEEELRRVIEISKTSVLMTDEEKIDLAIQMSKETASSQLQLAGPSSSAPSVVVPDTIGEGANLLPTCSASSSGTSSSTSVGQMTNYQCGFVGGKFSMNNNRSKTPLHGVNRNLSTSMKDLRVKRQERLKEIGQAQMKKPRHDERTNVTAGIMKTSIPKNLKLMEELKKT